MGNRNMAARHTKARHPAVLPVIVTSVETVSGTCTLMENTPGDYAPQPAAIPVNKLANYGNSLMTALRVQ